MPWSLFSNLTKQDLDKLEQRIVMKMSDLQGDLAQVRSNVTEAFTEISAKIAEQNAKIQALSDQLANGDADVPADAAATLEEIKALGQQLADIVPTPLVGGPSGAAKAPVPNSQRSR